LLFAIPLMILSFALASADSPKQGDQPTQTPSLDCKACHKEFEKSWKAGAHGQASTDPVFKEAWEAQGKPQECLACHVTGYDADTGSWQAEGITCQACHGDPPAIPQSCVASATAKLISNGRRVHTGPRDWTAQAAMTLMGPPSRQKATGSFALPATGAAPRTSPTPPTALKG
jgi:Cytochrome c554 and c-prime